MESFLYGNQSYLTDSVTIQHLEQRERNRLFLTLYNAAVTGHLLRRNCLLKRVIGGKMEKRIDVTGRRGRRRKRLLDEHKKERGYWRLKEDTLDCTMC